MQLDPNYLRCHFISWHLNMPPASFPAGSPCPRVLGFFNSWSSSYFVLSLDGITNSQPLVQRALLKWHNSPSSFTPITSFSFLRAQVPVQLPLPDFTELTGY